MLEKKYPIPKNHPTIKFNKEEFFFLISIMNNNNNGKVKKFIIRKL